MSEDYETVPHKIEYIWIKQMKSRIHIPLCLDHEQLWKNAASTKSMADVKIT